MFWYSNLWCVPIDLGDGKMNKKRLAKAKNSLAFQIAFARLVDDALSRYEIEGLPETVNARVVLQSLLWHANVVFFEREGSLMALPGAPSGDLNVYGDPIAAQVYSANGMFNERVDLYIHGSDEDAFLGKTDVIGAGKYKGVMVWENKSRFPFINSTFTYAQAIADTLRTLDVIRVNIKNPNVFVCEESVVATVKKYLSDREDNLESVISSGVFDPTKVQMLPYDNKGTAINDVTALVEWYESKYRELCGVKNNSQMDKKGENLIEAEVSVNDEYTQGSVEKCLETMQESLDDVNKLFGVNLTVKMKEKENEDIRTDDGSGADNMAGGDAGAAERNDK